MKRIVTLVISICSLVTLMANEVEFRAQAPNRVVAGRSFKLEYTINQDASNLIAPDFSGFDYLAGPYTSQSSYMQIVNGQSSMSYSLTITYTLVGRTPGEYTIGPATVTCNGQRYTSNGVRVTVLPPDKDDSSSSGSSSTGSSNQSNQPRSTSTSSSRGEIFLRTVVSKTNVYEQEALQVSYRLYFAGVDLAQMGNAKLPEFTGFLKQELDLGNLQWELEHYNERNYQVATLFSYVLFPQHAGDLKIDPAQVEVGLREQIRQQPRNAFEAFYGTFQMVNRTLTAPATTIHVKPLPGGKPQDFSGGVGQFTFTPSISTTDVPANEAITIQLEIAGSGNMKLIKTPTIDWPEGFEPYEPKVTNDFKISGSGYSGTKKIEYLAIPRAAGQYTIPAATFSYFDIKTGQYKTLSTPDYTIHVRRAAGGEAKEGETQTYHSVDKENIKELGTDIRYIHTDESALAATLSRSSFLSPSRVLLIDLGLLLLAIIAYVLVHRIIRNNADQTHVRYKRASKVAQKRLKVARQLLKSDNQAFYAEIEKASFQYLSDRLRIPTAKLTKDNIADLLRQQSVSEDIIEQVNSVLSTAEFARYAPTTGAEKQALYDATATIINLLEEQKL